MGLRASESVDGPIFAALGGERGSTDRARAGGVTRSPVAPVSVREDGTSRRPAAGLARAQQNRPVVETQLGVETATATDRTPTTPSTSNRGATSGAPGTQLAQGSTRRPTAEKVQVRGYNLSKPAEIRRSSVGSSTAGFPTADFPLTYIIQPDDNLWNIATKYYDGRGYLHKHIATRNPSVKIHPGKTLIIPAPPPSSKSSKSSKSGEQPRGATARRFANTPTRGTATRRTTPSSKMHTVQKGETLWEIARRAYGDPTQYVRIKNANPHLKNADKVKAGTKILIP